MLQQNIHRRNLWWSIKATCNDKEEEDDHDNDEDNDEYIQWRSWNIGWIEWNKLTERIDFRKVDIEWM